MASRSASNSTPNAPGGPLRIRKYANRRLYDQTGSRHLTNEQLYDLVAAGAEVSVIDARTEEDITNVVLAQLLIERDPLKLATFPPSLLHALIRTNERFLQSAVTRQLAAMVESMAQLQRPSSYGFGAAPSALPLPITTPGMEWMSRLFGSPTPPLALAPAGPPASTVAGMSPSAESAAAIVELRDELAALRAKLDAIGREGPMSDAPKRAAGRASKRAAESKGKTDRSASARRAASRRAPGRKDR